MMQFIPDFEKVTGVAVSPELAKLINALAAGGDYFKKLGIQDAEAGRTQRTKAAFIEWGEKEVKPPAEPIVELMYLYYTNGYNAKIGSLTADISGNYG